jgi:hypothetical protein
MKLVLLVFSIILLGVSCKKKIVEYATSPEEKNTITTLKSVLPITVTPSNLTQETSITIIVQNSNGLLQSGYTVAMFTTEPTEGVSLPVIEMEEISNTEGQVIFGLDSYIENPTVLYFEAFIETGHTYTWKSTTHIEKQMTAGTKWSDTINVID